MSYRDFAEEEIAILSSQIKKATEDIQASDEDPDTIGTEVEYSIKMLKLLNNVHHIVDYLSDCEVEDQSSIMYITGVLNDIFHGIPLTELNSYEDRPEEWEKWKNGEINTRYPKLIRRSINVKDNRKNKGTRIIYSDVSRFCLYDIITNRVIGIKDACFGIDTNIPFLQHILDSILPIEFPYNVKNDAIKLYIEVFECSLQPEMPPVKTLALTHYMKYADPDPKRIMRFFDISDGGINELDVKAYLPRRQIFEKSIEVCEETNSEDSHENDGV